MFVFFAPNKVFDDKVPFCRSITLILLKFVYAGNVSNYTDAENEQNVPIFTLK